MATKKTPQKKASGRYFRLVKRPAMNWCYEVIEDGKVTFVSEDNIQSLTIARLNDDLYESAMEEKDGVSR